MHYSRIETDILNNIITLSKSFKDSSNILIDSGGNITQTNRMSHVLYDVCNRASGIERMISSIILNSAANALRSSSFSSDLMIHIVMNSVEEIIREITLTGVNKINDLEKETIDLLYTRSRKSKIDDISTVIKRSIDDKLSSFMIDVISLAGYNGKIIIDNSDYTDSSIEVTVGNIFDDIVLPLGPISITTKWHRKFPRVIVVDGFIEHVHEIHRILDSAAKDKEPVLIVSRGFSDDVISTISFNRDRGTIDIIPVITKFDFTSINQITDIAMVAGCDPITVNSGKPISSYDLFDFPTIDSVTCIPSKLTLINNSTKSSVGYHVNRLRSKLDESSDIITTDALSLRIRNLSSRCVIVRLNSSSEQDKRLKHIMIDNCLSVTRDIIKGGIIDVGSFDNDMINDNVILMSVVDSVRSFDIVPFFGTINAIKLACSTMRCLLECDLAILHDRILKKD